MQSFCAGHLCLYCPLWTKTQAELLVTPLSLAGLITSLVSSCIVECRESFPRCCFSSLTRKKKKRDEREGRKRRRKRSERRKEMRRKSSKNDRCKQPAERSCESSAARRANHSESSKEENDYQEAPKRSLSKKRQHTLARKKRLERKQDNVLAMSKGDESVVLSVLLSAWRVTWELLVNRLLDE